MTITIPTEVCFDIYKFLDYASSKRLASLDWPFFSRQIHTFDLAPGQKLRKAVCYISFIAWN
jgi:hypothetical protein